MSESMFHRLVKASGLSSVFAERVVERACLRAGTTRSGLDAGNLRVVVPHVEAAMRIYLTGPELERALRTVHQLAREGA